MTQCSPRCTSHERPSRMRVSPRWMVRSRTARMGGMRRSLPRARLPTEARNVRRLPSARRGIKKSALSMPEVLAPSAPPATAVELLEPIRVRAKFFFEGDRKWFIKGVTYGPFAPDAAGDFVGDPEKARKDFTLMQDLGINLLR